MDYRYQQILQNFFKSGPLSGHNMATNSDSVTICDNKAIFVKNDDFKMFKRRPQRALFVSVSWLSQISLYPIYNINV